MNVGKEDILNEISKIIFEAFGEEAGLEQFLGGAAIHEMELDSMTFISVITRIEEQYEIEFEDDDLEILLYSSIEDTTNLTYEKLLLKEGV